jgi:glycosyltransferase involved in cell wall biosynthesis
MNSTEPFVTIAISTFNRANSFLETAVRSAMAQDYPHLEIIVSDNCSTDATSELIASLRDDRIVYIRHPKNIGANNNFNFCLERARGDYFLLLHDDDVIDSDFVKACMQAVDEGSVPGLIRTGTRVIDADGELKSERSNRAEGFTVTDFIFSWFEEKTSLYLCSTLFHTKTLRDVGGFHSPKNLYQDVAAELRVVARLGWVDVPEIKASFRRHDENMGGARLVEWCDDSLYLVELMCQLSPQDATEIRRIGMFFFCKQNYDRAARIESRMRRMAAQLAVYRKFEYVYSPLGLRLDDWRKRSGRANPNPARRTR